ncbi:TPR repeat protein [Paraburkholderia sp. BL23I1N1]|uniref:tetratricopeptide repeat protein n=1 Tax=Paraburkholderia sp. BL23I1N1 TaxID=1938802 RepID=UPI000FF320BC|nr:tetratricopeptide repeat protein [Paraburkholderia sp. BL23I1N1]RKE23960.1 TPR repeat protein [Paraburkholderia sp. BL23I1N1]
MKALLNALHIAAAALLLLVTPAHAGALTSLGNKLTTAMSDLPRYEKLPLFDPHRKDFTCVYEAQQVPPLDPQAEMWFQQALAMDDPNVPIDRIDYAKMYQLYLQAADRNHWKAMLNLASLILSKRPGVPEQDPEAAIQWVEKAIKLGIPDAYDRMGVYHLNRLVKGGDATSAYALFQRAADMGSPAAMAFLGDKLSGTYDDPRGEFWGNLPIASKMLECALAQGYGPAADKLSYIYRGTTSESKSRALHVLHEGVKLGCAECADNLSTEFNGFGLTRGENLVGHIDKARAQRYSKIGDVLKLYGGRLKLPNLDKVLPLPPAPLPKWDGNVQTLINGAKAVTPTPKAQQGAALQGREFIPLGHAVSPLEQSTIAVAGNQIVPRDGYWLALYGPASAAKTQLIPARRNTPERYQVGERFEASSLDWLAADHVQWHYLGEAYALPPQRDDFLRHMINTGFLREVPEPASPVLCNGRQRCPQTGIWEGRVASDHPMAVLYNRWDRQAFVEKDHAFPHPGGQFIDIATGDLQWTYLGSPNGDTGMPGILNILL